MKPNFIEGYKAIDGDYCNRFGLKFEVGKVVHIDGPIISGHNRGGIHICKKFEDTFRYVHTDREFYLCEVIGFGEIGDEYIDDSNMYDSYYDIYACSDVYVKRIISREEIFIMAKDLAKNYPWRLENFIMTYEPISIEEAMEIKEILSKYETKIKKMVDYYYLGDKNVFR